MWEYIIPGVSAVIVALVEALAARDRAKVKKDRKRAEELEQAREAMMLHMLHMSGASMALGEAVARAVQRIPDAHCNGEMTKALDYAVKVKHEQKEFLESQGVHALWE